MKQMLRSPQIVKKWCAVCCFPLIVLFLFFVSGHSGFAETILIACMAVLLIDLLVNSVLAEYEYTVIDGVFLYKRMLQHREKILFYVPLRSIIAILPEESPDADRYRLHSKSRLIPRFCKQKKYLAVYDENERYYGFLFTPDSDFLVFLQENLASDFDESK